jgi:hypothetical protein
MLTLSHFEAVAKLDDAEQNMFLEKADNEELTAAELKRLVKAAHPNPNRKTPTRKAIIDLDNEDGLLHASEKIVEFFEKPEEQEKPVPDWSKERKAKWFPTIARLISTFLGDDEPCREAAKAIALYLDNPDNGPLKGWSDARRKRWADSLNRIAKAGRRMGVTACGNAKHTEDGGGEPAAD